MVVASFSDHPARSVEISTVIVYSVRFQVSLSSVALYSLRLSIKEGKYTAEASCRFFDMFHLFLRTLVHESKYSGLDLGLG